MNRLLNPLLAGTLVMAGALTGCASQTPVAGVAPSSDHTTPVALTTVALDVVSEVLLSVTCEPDVQEGRSCDPAAEMQNDQQARQQRNRIRAADRRERRSELEREFDAFMGRKDTLPAAEPQSLVFIAPAPVVLPAR